MHITPSLGRFVILLAPLIVAGCAKRGGAQSSAEPSASHGPAFAVDAIVLPGAPAEGVFMDYILYDRARHRIWVPAGNTGSVDVIEVRDNRITQIKGFPTAEVERRGQKRTVGPSSATVGERTVYIGNRADSSVCEVDAQSLTKGACVTVESSPDGLAYVSATREIWVTTPRDNSITILDASHPGSLMVKAKIPLEGQPEGYAVDGARGVFYTNLEDKDRTVAIEIKTRRVMATWRPECGEDGPRGLAVDQRRGFLLVACPDHTVALDAAHGGRILSRVDTGDGVDSIEYVESRHEVYAAAARTAKLTVAALGRHGDLVLRSTTATKVGARNAVVTEQGDAYLTDSSGGKILVLKY